MALNPRQQRFVEEYLTDLNGTQAAIRAGYSSKTAGAIAEQNLKKLEIASAIQEAMNERSERTKVTADSVITELAKMGFSTIKDCFDSDGRLLPVYMLPDHVAASISSVKVTTSRVPMTDPVEVEHTAEIKFWDKKGSLELLGRHLKLFTDKVEHSGSITMEDMSAR